MKDLFNRRRILGMLPAAALTLFDTYLNNDLRWFYRAQEYPVVRALAALALLNVQEKRSSEDLIPSVRCHLDWLRDHAIGGYSGPAGASAFDSRSAPASCTRPTCPCRR